MMPGVKRHHSGELPSFGEVVPAWTRSGGPEVTARPLSVESADGRVIDAVVDGPERGPALVVCHGTPFSAGPWPDLTDSAARFGLRVVQISRPGFGASDRRPGRSVADGVDDVIAVLDELELGSFVALGWSEGGPHALACGAVAGTRCQAVATIGSPAPPAATGVDWAPRMAVERIAIAEAARTVAAHSGTELTRESHAGGDSLRRLLDRRRAALVGHPVEVLEIAFGGTFCPADVDALTQASAASLMASVRRAVMPGVDGWYDDWVALERDWGFDLSAVRVPVSVWHGADDTIVPASHGAWLADHMPMSRPHGLGGEGHVSSLLGHLDAILGDLVGVDGPVG
jgi:pimeloyl-ACP methyl ester carboxylesterase